MRSRKAYIGIFYGVTFLFWCSLYNHVSILSGRSEEVGATAFFIGIISGAYGFSQMLFRIPLGIWSDRIQKRSVFITGAFVSTLVAGLLMYMVPTPMGLFIGRVLCGLSASAYVQMTVLFSSYFSDEETPKAMGTMVSLMYLSQMSGMLFGGTLADHFGKPSTFLLTAGVAALGFVLSLFVYDKPIDREPINFHDIKAVVKGRWLIVASILAIVVQALAFGRSWAFVPLAANRIGATAMEQSFSTSIFTLTSMLSAFVIGRLRWNERGLILIGFGLQALGSFIIPLVPTLGGLYLSQGLTGIGNGVIFTLLMGMAIRGISEHLRGTAMGTFQALYGIGMFIGPVFFGALAESYPLNVGFIATGILSLMGLVAAYFMVAKPRSEAINNN